MPFPMKIQPIRPHQQEFKESSKPHPPVFKERLKRLFDRPFNNVLKISSVSGDKPTTEISSGGGDDVKDETPAPVEFEPSSLCLDNMVQNFIEEITYDHQKPPVPQKCGRNRCNCFSGNNNSSDDDEIDFVFGESMNSPSDSLDILKSLIPCPTKVESNLLADVSKIIDKNKICKRKDDLRKFVTDRLLSLGFIASICNSKWDKSSSIPAAGEYEYIDVMIEGERVLIDIDFRSEFEIARSTGNYRAILQSVPFIFVGKADRLQQIITIVSEAAQQSLKKKGMHMAPWRKAEYMRAKWLSPFVRTTTTVNQPETPLHDGAAAGIEYVVEESECGELISVEKGMSLDEPDSYLSSVAKVYGGEVKGLPPVLAVWQPPEVKSKSCCEKGNRVIVTGLASLLKERP